MKVESSSENGFVGFRIRFSVLSQGPDRNGSMVPDGWNDAHSFRERISLRSYVLPFDSSNPR